MRMKIFAFLALAAASVFGATQTTKEYVDAKDLQTRVALTNYVNSQIEDAKELIPTDYLPLSWTNENSIVAGHGASSSGGVNTVIGSGAIAEGVGATAFGEMCRSIGQHAVAFGSARALGDYCVAMGLNAEASAAYALAIGENSIALNQYTFAAGTEAVASNYNAFAIGNKAKSLGQDSVAIGNNAQALAFRTAAIGLDTSANGWNAMAIGSTAIANGLSSIAVGTGAGAYGTYATSLGMTALASNSYTVAIGYNSKANSSGAVAIGNGSKATNTYAVAIGQSASAGNSGVAFGFGAEAGVQSVAIGRDAKARHTAAVAIGPMAETTADSTMRIKYAPSEIYIGFWQAKSLQAYFDELDVDIDYQGITNLVNNAPYLPKTVYGKYYSSTVNLGGWNITSNATALTSTWEFKGAGSAKPTMVIGSGAKLQIGYGSLDVTSSGSMYLRNPNRVYVGADGTTNLVDYIASVGGGVTEGRVGEIATNVVRECSLGGIWDATLQVWWTPVMSNGKLTYQATTNVNLNAGN